MCRVCARSRVRLDLTVRAGTQSSTTGMLDVTTESDTVSVGGPMRVASSRRWRSTSSM